MNPWSHKRLSVAAIVCVMGLAANPFGNLIFQGKAVQVSGMSAKEQQVTKESLEKEKSTQEIVQQADETGKEKTKVHKSMQIIYVPDDCVMNLVPKQVQAERDPQKLINELIRQEVLPQHTVVNEFTVYDKNGKVVTKDFDKLDGLTAKLDLSKAYVEKLRQTGTCGECVLIYSVADTLIEAYHLNSIFLTGEGEEIETGHRVMDHPLTFTTEL